MLILVRIKLLWGKTFTTIYPINWSIVFLRVLNKSSVYIISYTQLISKVLTVKRIKHVLSEKKCFTYSYDYKIHIYTCFYAHTHTRKKIINNLLQRKRCEHKLYKAA